MEDGRFTIWVVEDEEDPQTTPWQSMLAETFGQDALATASWRLFTTAKAAIDELRSGAGPDIALVDVNLQRKADNDASDTVGVHAQTRGLVVAAALQSLSEKRSRVVRVVLYSANKTVEGIKEDVLKIPRELEKLGVRPLIEIKEKAQGSAPEVVLPWIESEIRLQAEKRIKALGSSSAESKVLCGVMLQLREAPPLPAVLPRVWEAVDKLKADYAELPAELRGRIDHSMIRHAEGQRRLGPDRGIAELRQAFAEDSCDRWALKQWTQNIQPLVDQLATELRRSMNNRRKTLRQAVKSLQERDWYRGLRDLAPMEFRRLEAFAEDNAGSTEACSEAIMSVLSLLSSVDHTASLARAFLSLSEDGGDRIPTTVFAHACHKWSLKQHWPYKTVEYDVSDEIRELYLKQELGRESGGPFAKLRLPERSLRKIEARGKEQNPEYPLLGFASLFGADDRKERCEWEAFPIDRLKRFGWKVEGDPAPRVLTDWEFLFGPVEDDPPVEDVPEGPSLIAGLMKLEGLVDPRVVVTNHGADDKVSVRFEFDKTSDGAPVNLMEFRGSTIQQLRKFLTWGKLEVISTTRAGSFRTRRDLAPDPIPSFQGAPFQVELTLQNYAATRKMRTHA